MEQVMAIANSPMLWILSLASISMVLWQTWLYYKIAKNYVRDTDVMTQEEINKCLTIGVISTIGPAVAVFTVAVVLIGLVGGPQTLARIGVIGSAAFESLAASAGSGGSVGTEEFTISLFTTATWVMAIGGSGWLVSTFFLTKSLDNAQEKMKQSNPAIIAFVGSMAPFMVFSVMGYGEVMKDISAETPSYGTLAALVAGAVTMLILNKIGHTKKGYRWLLEWAMGIAIIVAMIAGVIAD